MRTLTTACLLIGAVTAWSCSPIKLGNSLLASSMFDETSYNLRSFQQTKKIATSITLLANATTAHRHGAPSFLTGATHHGKISLSLDTFKDKMINKIINKNKNKSRLRPIILIPPPYSAVASREKDASGNIHHGIWRKRHFQTGSTVVRPFLVFIVLIKWFFSLTPPFLHSLPLLRHLLLSSFPPSSLL